MYQVYRLYRLSVFFSIFRFEKKKGREYKTPVHPVHLVQIGASRALDFLESDGVAFILDSLGMDPGVIKDAILYRMRWCRLWLAVGGL